MLERIARRPVALQGKGDVALGASVEMLADQNDLLGR